jgi:hypothetical protein
MARVKRHFLPGHVWHITHRCHKKGFLLKLVKDRQRYGTLAFKSLMSLLQIETYDELRQSYRKWIEEALKKSKLVRKSKWTQSIAACPIKCLIIFNRGGDKSFLEQIKERLGIRAKGHRIYESQDECQERDRQAVYSDGQDSDTENTFDWNIKYQPIK